MRSFSSKSLILKERELNPEGGESRAQIDVYASAGSSRSQEEASISVLLHFVLQLRHGFPPLGKSPFYKG